MGESLNFIQAQVRQFMSRLSGQQKLLLGFIAVALMSMLIVFLVWTSSTPYEPLYSNLAPSDAAEVVEKLREQGVDFKLQNGGTTVAVPSQKVYEMRLLLAKDGLPQSGTSGYNILDSQELGVTEFQQKIAYKRAIEGELAKTIGSIESVDAANVLIVIPKERLFEKDQKFPTASVQLKLKSRSLPRQMTIEAISNLVANSIEGLTPENVTITDTRGRILSQKRDGTGTLSMSNTQMEFTNNIEKNLENKALQVLEKRVGQGNVTIQITAALNWAQIERTVQEVDPDKSVTVSEETSEQASPASEGGAAGKSSNTITNYETSKTVQRIVEEVGNIKNLSIAVMINNATESTTDADGNTTGTSVARGPAEMQQLEALVKSAVGFREDRNDQLSVINMEFGNNDFANNFEDATPWWGGDMFKLLETVLILLAIVGGIILMRSILSQAKVRGDFLQSEIMKIQKQPVVKGSGALADGSGGDLALAEGEDEESVILADDFFKSGKASSQRNDQIRSYIKTNPEVANKLLKVWLMEEGD